MIKKFYSLSFILIFISFFQVKSIAQCITKEPTNQIVCAGSPAQFTIVASGSPITYQWQVNDKVNGFVNLTDNPTYSGSTSSILNVNSTTTLMDGYSYRCIVGCSAGPNTSYSGYLSTKISVNPLSSKVGICSQGMSMINVNATGTNLSYKWQIQGPYPGTSSFTDITDNMYYGGMLMMNGSKTSNLMINYMGNYMGPDGTKFRCIVYNSCEPAGVISTETVAYPSIMSPPPNNTTVCAGSAAQFTVYASSYDYSMLFYQWQVSTGGAFTDITDNAVYSNSQTSTLKINSADNSMNGYKYLCRISGAGCGLYSTPATLSVDQPLSITTQPTDKIICSGVNTNFSATVTGSYPFYQWQVNKGTGFTNLSNDATYSGAYTNNLQISNTDASMDSWQYKLNITSNYCGNTSSNSVKLTVNPSVSITQPTNQTTCVGQAANFSVTATGSVQTYKWQVNKGPGFTDLANDANYSGVSTNSLQIATTDASMSGYLYRVNMTSSCGNLSSNSATLTVNPVVTISQPAAQTICSGVNTDFSVTVTGTVLSYQWQVYKGSTTTDINDDANYSGTTTNSLHITNTDVSMDGWLYSVKVTTTCGTESSQTGKLTVVQGAQLLNITNNQNIHVGDPLVLTLTTQGNYLNYSWAKDNVSFTNQSYIYYVSSASIQDSGTYKVQISNTCGSTMFKYVHVSVTDIVTQPTANTSDEGQSLIFTVDTYQTPTTYQWQVDKGTGFQNIVDGNALKTAAGTPTYSGATTNQLTITNVSFDMNNYKYRCLIQTSGGDEYSNDATLTVNKTTGVNKATSTKLEVYPNPAQDYITIKNLQENAVITIYNQQGIQLKSFNSNENAFSISDISKGYYILEVEQNNMVARTPLVIK